ncbi:unknown [Clostridium sp. CAG:524]|jgi:hypothetical protein|nr:unknown [Clostridium sp. CAG:524]
MLNKYYNLFPDKIFRKNNSFYFFENNEKIVIKTLDSIQIKNISELSDILKHDKNLSKIILNNENKEITEYKEKKYILLSVIVINRRVYLDDLFLKFENLAMKNADNTDLLDMISKLVVIEKRMLEFNTEYLELQKSFDYFIGLAENSIQLINKIKFDNLKHVVVNISDIDEYNYEEINNIANLEFGNMEKSISAYIKYKIYMDTLNYDEIYSLINNRMLNIELLYAYMLYPNFYFNDVIQIIDNCKKEKCIYKYIKYNNLYIKFMKYLYEELSDNIKSIGNNFWINLL